MGVYTMAPDGSDERLFKEGEQLASWSPDARRIAFMRSTPPTGAGQLMVTTFNSDEEVTVATNDHYLFPKWSPDGSHLVSPSSRGLSIVEDDGENQAFVANTDHRDTAAGFAPDCERLVFEFNTGEGVDVYTINIDGTGRTRLSPDGPGNDAQPDWSPDGTQIAFARRIDDRDTQIFVMRPDGTDVRQLTHEVGWHGHPSWSPDGTMIAYAGQAFVDGQWRAPIHVMRADGTDRHHIGPYDSPAWAPDWGSALD
jgi:TolB protein